MVGIAGWIDFSRPLGAPEEIARSMAAGLGNGLGGDTVLRATPHAGLALCAHPKMASSYFGEELWAVIHGYPRWHDSSLAEAARAMGDARALADGYARFGRDVLKKLGGACSVAIVDLANRAVLAAVDRVGIETMCYASPSPGVLVFGTRTTAVARHPSVSSTLSNQAFYNYVQSFVIMAPVTIFDEQKKLQRSEFVELRNGRVDTGVYWETGYVSDGPVDEAALMADTRHALRNGVARTIEGEDIAKVGAFLSGGLDSSTVSGFLKEVGGRARTFTIGFGVEGFDETPYARMAADHFGTEHTEIIVTPDDMLELMPKIREVYDEPFANVSLIPAFCCAKRAQEAGVEVMLAGDGGDELFGGNEHYVNALRIESYAKLPKLLRTCLIEPIAMGVPGLSWIKPIYKARRWIEQFRIPIVDRIHPLYLPGDWTLTSIFEPGILDGVEREGDHVIQRAIFSSTRSPSPLQRMLNLDMQVVLADNDLRKVNRMCELAGVRVRYPMLDEDVIDTAARIPPDVMIPGLKLRDFYKRTFSNFLPDGIINKKKHGFHLPALVWMMDDGRLRDYVLDCLASFRKRHIMNATFLAEVANYRDHEDSYGIAGLALDLAFLELWLENHIDAAAQSKTNSLKFV